MADRFHLKPLLRAVTMPQQAFVLALAHGGRVLAVRRGDIPQGADLAAILRDAI